MNENPADKLEKYKAISKKEAIIAMIDGKIVIDPNGKFRGMGSQSQI